MFQPLRNTAAAFEQARAEYAVAAEARDLEAGVAALAELFTHANNILTFLGLVEPFGGCGECDNCKANASSEAAQARAEAAELIATDAEFWNLIRSSEFNPETGTYNTEESE